MDATFQTTALAGGVVVVAIRGVVDRTSVDAFHAAFAAALSIWPVAVVVDCGSVTSVDSDAVSALLAGCRAATAAGVPVTIKADPVISCAIAAAIPES